MRFKLLIDTGHEEEVTAIVHRRTPVIDEIERLITQENAPDRLYGYINDDIVMLDTGSIECFFAQSDRTYAVSEDKKTYLIRNRLYSLEAMLPPQFIRISKSAIANTDRINRFKVQLSGAVDIVFKSGYTECVSRRCFAEIKRRYGL